MIIIQVNVFQNAVGQVQAILPGSNMLKIYTTLVWKFLLSLIAKEETLTFVM